MQMLWLLKTMPSLTYLTRGFEAKTNSLVVPQSLLPLCTLAVQEDGGLFLEGLLVLCEAGSCKRLG